MHKSRVMFTSSFFRSALTSGIIVGILDGTAASVNAYLARGIAPSAVFRYVASGAFGKDAFSMSESVVVYGLLFHFIIAIAWTFLFYALATRIRFLTTNWLPAGLGYGVLVWIGMNAVVLPLSRVAPLVYRLVPTTIMIGIHMFVIGLSISYLASRYFRKAS
jgi:hypothetical protein